MLGKMLIKSHEIEGIKIEKQLRGEENYINMELIYNLLR